MAEFNYIIASIWITEDEIYIKIINKFYGRLKNGYAEKINNKIVATAVHDSIVEIRSI
jgi:hypothetical protein